MTEYLQGLAMDLLTMKYSIYFILIIFGVGLAYIVKFLWFCLCAMVFGLLTFKSLCEGMIRW